MARVDYDFRDPPEAPAAWRGPARRDAMPRPSDPEDNEPMLTRGEVAFVLAVAAVALAVPMLVLLGLWVLT